MDPKRRKTSAKSESSKRRGGDIVPVPPSSSSKDGLSGELPACPPDKLTSARPAQDGEPPPECKKIRERLEETPSEDWRPVILPRFRELMAYTREEYYERIYIFEMVLQGTSEWPRKEKQWTEYADGLEDTIKELEGRLRKVKEKGKREGKHAGAGTRDIGVQTDQVEKVTEMELEEEEDRVKGKEGKGDRNLSEVVALLSRSLGALEREMGEIRAAVRSYASAAGPPSGTEVDMVPPSTRSSVVCGAPTGGRSAGGGGRGTKRKGRASGPARVPPAAVHPPVSRGHPAAGRSRAGLDVPLPPQSAAVLVRGGEGFSYAEALRMARREIPLPEMGIADSSVRRTADGGLLVEVRGPGVGEKADALAGRLRSLLPEASIARPERNGEVRLIGFDESVLPEELKHALAESGGCGPERVHIGAPRWGLRGSGVAWAKLPLVAAIRAARAGHLTGVGWSAVRVVMLDRRPLQCHRCWGYGHLRANCPNTGPDRSHTCYRCGREGHTVQRCTSAPSCIVCKGAGLDARHRMGGTACGMANRVRDGRDGCYSRRRGRPPAGKGKGGGV